MRYLTIEECAAFGEPGTETEVKPLTFETSMVWHSDGLKKPHTRVMSCLAYNRSFTGRFTAIIINHGSVDYQRLLEKVDERREKPSLPEPEKQAPPPSLREAFQAGWIANSERLDDPQAGIEYVWSHEQAAWEKWTKEKGIPTT